MPSSPGIRNAALPPDPPTALRADRRGIQRRLLAEGPGGLSDAELLSLAWGLGVRRAPSPLRVATLLEQFGGMGGLFAAPQKQLARAGLGPAAWSVLQAALELARRSVAQHLRQGKLLCSPEMVGHYLALSLQHRPREVFAVIFLDARNRLLAAEDLFQGTLSQTAVYPREVARRALECNAAAVILAHNHPSGVAEPSPADRQLTETLQRTLRCLDIPVLDHVIVAGGQRFSFAEHGLL
jgi:DNA repair protein RadC